MLVAGTLGSAAGTLAGKIVLTIARKSFNVPAKLGVPYRKEG